MLWGPAAEKQASVYPLGFFFCTLTTVLDEQTRCYRPPAGLAPLLPAGMAAPGCGGRPDGVGGGHSQGHGLCRHRRPAAGRRAVQLADPAGGLRRARHRAGAQRDHHLHHRHPGGRHHRPGRRRRRCRAPDGDRHHPVAAGGGVPAAGGNPAPRRGGQPDLRAGAYRLQGGDRPGHRPRPVAQAAGDSHHQGRVLPRHRVHRPPPAGTLHAHPAAGAGHAAADGRPGAFHPEGAGAAGHGRRRYCPGRLRRVLDRHGDPTGRQGAGRAAGLRSARSLAWRNSSGPAPWASP